MENIDLRSLLLLDEIYKARSLSAAADKLGLTQPGASLALTRLRRQFDDALFVRTTSGMQGTSLLEELMPTIRQGIVALQAARSFRMQFVAPDSDRIFRISMTDVGQIVLLPPLLDRLGKVAPNIRVEVSTIDKHVHKTLEAGDIDLAVGFVSEASDSTLQQVLFEERFACLVRRDHPRVGDRLTLRQYQAESHVMVTTSGTGHHVVERTLEKLKIRRRVSVWLPSFLGLSTVIGATDHICTLPRRAAALMEQRGGVRMLELPFELPSYVVKQIWHARQAQDPANKWLRNQLADMYAQARTGRQRTTR
ncbi:DNA-binding transcriptional LysR family regulator [Hydrogenophaga palleronii]|uniref:DNA-binding transcriptional LysR family regulator n=2 Tax=Hydrogenophaga palleronii TaxID=65655 RepID=A0ABU1WRY2_9BURK|nr:DNA-binding transcriptional LysR family regulator [Hydrogenophaga palleronii]